MKKTIIAMLLASTLVFTACGDLTKTGILDFEDNGSEETEMIEETTEETTEEIFAEEIPTTTAETEAAPAQSVTNKDSSSSSETSSKKSVPAKKSIKVTNAVNKTFKSDKIIYLFKIPKVTISGVDTSDANKRIKDATYAYYKGGNKKHYAASYKYFINKKTVSILVCVTRLAESDPTYVYVYNIKISSGKLISDGELVKLYGTTTKSFFSKVKSIYKKFNKAETKIGGGKEWTSENLKKVSYRYIHPYINSKGHLCFIGETNRSGGSGFGYTSFDLSSKKYIKIAYYKAISKVK